MEKKDEQPAQQARVKCTRCKVFHDIDRFNIKQNGKVTKQCKRCCNVMDQFRAKSKCIHGKQKAGCKKCLGIYKPHVCEICKRNINNDK